MLAELDDLRQHGRFHVFYDNLAVEPVRLCFPGHQRRQFGNLPGHDKRVAFLADECDPIRSAERARKPKGRDNDNVSKMRTLRVPTHLFVRTSRLMAPTVSQTRTQALWPRPEMRLNEA